MVDWWLHGCILNCCRTFRGPYKTDPLKRQENLSQTFSVVTEVVETFTWHLQGSHYYSDWTFSHQLCPFACKKLKIFGWISTHLLLFNELLTSNLIANSQPCIYVQFMFLTFFFSSVQNLFISYILQSSEISLLTIKSKQTAVQQSLPSELKPLLCYPCYRLSVVLEFDRNSVHY